MRGPPQQRPSLKANEYVGGKGRHVSPGLGSPLTLHEYFPKVAPFKVKTKIENALCGVYDKKNMLIEAV